GILAKDFVSIFQPFVRGRHPTASGSGLGLSIVKRVIENHGGLIVVENIIQPDRSGLRVTIKLPIPLGDSESASDRTKPGTIRQATSGLSKSASRACVLTIETTSTPPPVIMRHVGFGSSAEKLVASNSSPLQSQQRTSDRIWWLLALGNHRSLSPGVCRTL